MRAQEFTPGNRDLIIFDIDDTLMHTTAKIKVVKNGQVVRELSNQEFNNYQLQPGEEFDFGEFRNAEKFRQESKPIVPMIRKLKTIIAHAGNANIIMLTARADFDDKDTFLQTFKDIGIDMSRIHVHRAGNLPGNEAPAYKKAVWVRRYLDTKQYGHVRLYDDSMSNLRVFKELQKEYPSVDFRAIYVGPGGTTQAVEDYDPNDRPPGPETPPTMPAGTVRVDVSDVYDWYKLGQHISNLKGLGKHDFGKGPPSTIMSFGSEEEEHEYIKALQKTGLSTTDIDPVDPKQPKGMKRQKVDPTYNVGENMDHSKDFQAVPELKAALLAHKEKIQDASDDEVYDIIDKMMTRIAKSHGISGQKLHDMWVEKYKQIPDTWIMKENFADGKNPQDKGDSKRHGINTKASVSSLRKTAKQGGRKGQLAHWLANMKSGRAKKK